MTDYQPPPTFLPACERLDLPGVVSVLPRLTAFVEYLLETNKQFNLTAIREPEQAWMRHILDSLSLQPRLGSAVAIMDIGAGGGLPGIPLAILQPDRSFTLLDSTGKKVAFLRSVITDLDLKNVRAVHERAETAGHHDLHRERYDLCISRSVASLPTLLEYMLPFVRPGGRALAMKGQAAQDELAASQGALRALGGKDAVVHPLMPGVEDEAVVVEVQKAKPTPREYPRHPGTPKKNPL